MNDYLLTDFQIRCEDVLLRRIRRMGYEVRNRQVIPLGFDEGEYAITGEINGIKFWIYNGYGADMETSDGSGGHYEPDDFDNDGELIEAFVSEMETRLR